MSGEGQWEEGSAKGGSGKGLACSGTARPVCLEQSKRGDAWGRSQWASGAAEGDLPQERWTPREDLEHESEMI